MRDAAAKDGRIRLEAMMKIRQKLRKEVTGMKKELSRSLPPEAPVSPRIIPR